MITEDYVSFETAKLLKEKGFNEYTFSDYSEDGIFGFNEVETKVAEGYQRPTLQMAMKWLRDVHNLHIEARITNHSMSSLFEIVKYYWVVFNSTNAEWVSESSLYTLYFNSYEEACEAAIKYCLEKLI